MLQQFISWRGVCCGNSRVCSWIETPDHTYMHLYSRKRQRLDTYCENTVRGNITILPSHTYKLKDTTILLRLPFPQLKWKYFRFNDTKLIIFKITDVFGSFLKNGVNGCAAGANKQKKSIMYECSFFTIIAFMCTVICDKSYTNRCTNYELQNVIWPTY